MMLKRIRTNEESELAKYRDLVLATLDYCLENILMEIKTENFDSAEYFKNLKVQTQEHFKKGRLSKLKKWFRDMTDPFLDSRDFKFSKYLQEKTKDDINIFESYFKRVDKVIEKGKINSDNQFYDLSNMVDQITQNQYGNTEKLEAVNRLLEDFEKSKIV